MRTIGLIGGMSWESSAEYYRMINEETRHRLGGHHCAPSLLLTLDFAEIEAMQRAGDWDAAGARLAAAARTLEAAGADLVLLCTNTMHLVADAITSAVGIEFVHIVDATAERVVEAGHRRVGLLATRYTMEHGFYHDRMRAHGIEVIVPDEPDRTLVHDVIYKELTRNRIENSSRLAYQKVMAQLAERGAEALVLGCTEITLLVSQDDCPVPMYDTTRIHVEAAVDLALTPETLPVGP
ncbi:aspartate/glutamate racemase family protein [Actinopolymorpha alba]|uniref:aspartate/glutamate racemase family protein n=1 Tax=Actinopolymorpha alba TaxID=533267 RepID=UPI0003618EF7|nr:aspartate/glutamate racemase family protein [Actinopolymorpha alba]